jgi:hypothetical protein
MSNDNIQLHAKSLQTDAITASAQRLAHTKVIAAQQAYRQEMSAGMTHLLVSAVEDHNPEILGRLAAAHQLEGARLIMLGTITRFVVLVLPCGVAAWAVGLGMAGVAGTAAVCLAAAAVLSALSVGKE